MSRRFRDRLISCSFDADRVDAHKHLALLLPKLASPAFVLSDNALSNPEELAAYLTMIKGLERFQHVVIPIGKGLSVAYAGLRLERFRGNFSE